MKYTLLVLLLASTLLSAKTDMADILFHTSYTESKETTFEQKKDRAYIGYCLQLLYLPHDYVDTKILHAEYEIESYSMNNKKAVIKACKEALAKPNVFSAHLLSLIEKFR
jgi:hypothetical protein